MFLRAFALKKRSKKKEEVQKLEEKVCQLREVCFLALCVVWCVSFVFVHEIEEVKATGEQTEYFSQKENLKTQKKKGRMARVTALDLRKEMGPSVLTMRNLQ